MFKNAKFFNHLICVFFAVAGQAVVRAAYGLHFLEPPLELVVLMQKLFERHVATHVLIITLQCGLCARILNK